MPHPYADPDQARQQIAKLGIGEHDRRTVAGHSRDHAGHRKQFRIEHCGALQLHRAQVHRQRRDSQGTSEDGGTGDDHPGTGEPAAQPADDGLRSQATHEGDADHEAACQFDLNAGQTDQDNNGKRGRDHSEQPLAGGQAQGRAGSDGRQEPQAPERGEPPRAALTERQRLLGKVSPDRLHGDIRRPSQPRSQGDGDEPRGDTAASPGIAVAPAPPPAPGGLQGIHRQKCHGLVGAGEAEQQGNCRHSQDPAVRRLMLPQPVFQLRDTPPQRGKHGQAQGVVGVHVNQGRGEEIQIVEFASVDIESPAEAVQSMEEP
jgi:hypothetical protein